MVFEVSPGQHVLFLWSAGCPPEMLKSYVESLQKGVEPGGKVQVENVERLGLSNHAPSSFDVALSGQLNITLHHSIDFLGVLAKILKPGGIVCVREGVTTNEQHPKLRTPAKLQSVLKLSGFMNISECDTVSLSDDEKAALQTSHGSEAVSVVEVHGKKPNYEVGASTQLKLPWAQPAVSADVASVWTLSATDMGDDGIDLMDSDELLSADDLKKPDPASLRAECGTGGDKKKKACKNCSCGLAEEQAGEKPRPKTESATSACGNCFLGDAFRCASCPYVGLPAFKPGEKVTIAQTMLKADQ